MIASHCRQSALTCVTVDIVEAHCYFVDIRQTDREQIRSRINNNDCRMFRLQFCTQLTKAFMAEISCSHCYWFCYVFAHDQFARVLLLLHFVCMLAIIDNTLLLLLLLLSCVIVVCCMLAIVESVVVIVCRTCCIKLLSCTVCGLRPKGTL